MPAAWGGLVCQMCRRRWRSLVVWPPLAWHHQTPDHGLLSDDLHKLLEVKHVRGCQKYR